jgi:two-component system, NtrC family, response regulator HydG
MSNLSALSSELSTDHYKFLDIESDEFTDCDHEDEWLALEALSARAESFAGMVVKSEMARKLIRQIIQLAPYRATVLIQGESGTGKELVAEALHKLGPSPKGPLVVINCSNLVGSLAEAQLFGHVRGAFTDAREDSLGYFRSANGGTLFLDEIGELPMGLQPKLLRAIETWEVQPVGSVKSHKVEVRLIAATNRDLLGMIKAGEFRADLYYRLAASVLRIPPLHQRRDGIAALVAHFAECYNRLFDKQVSHISRRAIRILENADWPGNVRQLSNVIQSSVMIAKGSRICTAHLIGLNTESVEVENRQPDAVLEADLRGAAPADPLIFRQAVSAASKAALIAALKQTGGNCARTARLLGISRPTVYRLIARHGLARRDSFSMQ